MSENPDWGKCVESSKLIDSALTIKEATKLIVSAGLVVPERKALS